MHNEKAVFFNCLEFFDKTIEIAYKLAPKKSILTNLHVDLDYQSLRKKLPKNIIPAYDGLSFNF